ncbi:N-acetylmuramoyl-L-alanine amidase family protein [Anaerocolumna sp. MB42-C2]|uniref:N-acetylmuramoyl-L-alanine amidase family protein n=1 Tax=Anaerocolumna sp. MB42-C2 TaxID=3070997 RepID=UPI0027E197DF|nr:N-acetylmuramoyl-L-alanine amidase [Anaerocolumna sp. MB42-C2]WMJ86057.1 N-acetylmuramoyl-L-alanine amidase [Anaerocolumna sp. MB42-C2]
MAIKIFIDQGHNPSGYFNSGAEANGVYESEVNYQVGIYLQNLLNNDPRFEARVSRPTPDTILGTNNSTSLQERVRMANEWPADYFISIHCNSNPNPDVNGTEVYIYQTGTQSNWLAAAVLTAVTQTVGTRNNGVRVNPSLYVLRRTNMPSILIELAYVTNESDAQKLRDDQYQFANGIYLGIKQYFGFQ